MPTLPVVKFGFAKRVAIFAEDQLLVDTSSVAPGATLMFAVP